MMWIAFIYELVMLVFSTLLGLAIMPDTLRDSEDSCVSLFFAPLIGFSVFESVSYFAGNILPYGRTLVILLYVIAFAVIVLRRKQLYLIKDKTIWIYTIALTALSLVIIYSCQPHIIDGGMYFMNSSFDHQRTALVDAIALAGFPLRTPWLADGGKLITYISHCGLHTVMAQPVILFGMQSFEAGAGIQGLVFIMTMLTAGALSYKLSGRKLTWIFLVLVFMSGSPGDVLTKYVSPFWKGLMSPGEYYKGVESPVFFGFWPLVNDMIWSPHCIFSATITLFLIYFYCVLLKESDKKRNIHVAIIMGSMAAAAFISNIYSGVIALFIFVLSLVPVYLFSKDFRKDFNAAILYQIIVVIVSLLMASPFFYGLFSQENINVGTLYGVLPPFNSTKGPFGIIIVFLEFTLITMTARCGISQLLGIVAMIVPGVLPKKRFVRLSVNFFLFISVMIFFCYSSFYTNDLGWRTPASVKLFCWICTAVLLTECFFRLYAKKAVFAYALLTATAGLMIVLSGDLTYNLTPECNTGHETHVVFAEAAEGWKDVRKITGKTDLVLCNPMAFSEMTYNYLTDSYKSYFFSYFAGRFSAMADLTLSKDMISDEETAHYEALYQFVVDFFTANPSVEDVRYVAEEMKVKALLVTPEDSLWNNYDVLLNYYDLKSETDGFKVFGL